MYLDLGNNNFVSIDEIVAIIDSNTAISSEENHSLIIDYEKNGDVINCASGQIKSYVFCESTEGKKIYTSAFSTGKLKDRLISYN